jgi:GT2 family glycosyltransferase
MKHEQAAAFVIPTWNGKHFLKNCLDSIYNQTYKNIAVYLVDNGSVDGTKKYIKENYPKVKLIWLKKNLGFAKGTNIGVKSALKQKEIKYIVCVNNDTVLDKSFLTNLVNTAEENEKTGIVVAKIMFPNGRINSLGTYIRLNGYGGNISIGEKDREVKSEEVFGVNSAFLAKRQVFEQVGLFDECFISYYEDIDFSIRARKAGWKIILEPKAIIFHHHSGTYGTFSKRKLYFTERNRLIVLAKHYSLLDFLKGFFFGPYYLLKSNKRRDYQTGEKVKINYFSLLFPYLQAISTGVFIGFLFKLGLKKSQTAL